MGASAPVALVPFLVLCSVQAIRVPVDWNSDSAVTNEKITQDVEPISAANVPPSDTPVPIPVEYFQYPAQKPQFAIDVAKFHGVNNPESHYSAHPIRPYTGVETPILGQHKILNEDNQVFENLQQFTKLNDNAKDSVAPISSEYEVFHPYKSEEPALQAIYKDPILEKIRNDIYNSQNRLQKYEKDAGESDVQDGEYLETPEQTDRKKFPQRNVPVPYEIHRPQRRPIYYRLSPYTSRDHYLNHRFRHPWNQHHAKIRPLHYRPLKSHIHSLRQNHAIKYDDERNEYPQVPTHEEISEIPEGYDIYERGKAKYTALRNNVDESINNAVKQNRPTTYHRLELQNNGEKQDVQFQEDDHEFVPIKNYAQVRKTETTKHLPKHAAFEDATSFDEIKNAPRLKEAIKSTKAQTVYSEEGYEDAAYDHEGEEKHAAENEAHGGFLKEKEISGGKFKTPSVNEKYQDASGHEYGDETLHGEQWKNDDTDKEKEADEEDYSEDDTAHSVEADVYDEVTGGRDKREKKHGENLQENDSNDDGKNTSEVQKERKKRENMVQNTVFNDTNNTQNDNDVNKINVKFLVPVINLNDTYFTPDELSEKARIVAQPKPNQRDNIKQKYPYYFKNLIHVHRNSPLKYAENLKFIPNKTKGGTEFYDSRSKILECPEVDDVVDVIPEKLNKEGHPDESISDETGGETNSGSGKADFSQLKKNRRLNGLGDKIDCFKAKFFGENPLDSPFFKEDIISNPEPVTAPNLPIYKLKSKEPILLESNIKNVLNDSATLRELSTGASNLYEKLQEKNQNLQRSLLKSNEELTSSLLPHKNFSLFEESILSPKSNTYSDILENIGNNFTNPLQKKLSQALSKQIIPQLTGTVDTNKTYVSFKEKQDVVKQQTFVRRKRGTPFTYEPYKIIRDSSSQDTKKTTITSKANPLIKKIQRSQFIDKVAKSADEREQLVKRNISLLPYKDIGKNNRTNIFDKGSKDSSEIQFVDVSLDSRRGEPRYEIKLPNHKLQYAPVDSRKTISLEDYEARTKKNLNKTKSNSKLIEQLSTLRPFTQPARNNRQKRPKTETYIDNSFYIPKATSIDTQKVSASNTVRQVIKSSNPTQNQNMLSTSNRNENDDEDYEEYDDDEPSTTTTTSTPKPSFRRRRLKTTTSTFKPEIQKEEIVLPKLRLITRFNTTPAPIKTAVLKTEPSTEKTDIEIEHTTSPNSPKYREKKKKSSKSTLVTDTKTYGEDGEDDMMKDEIDAMIGVQHDMEEYKPLYEKEMEEKSKRHPTSSASSEEDKNESETFEENDRDDSNNEDDDDSESYEDEEDSESLEIESEVTTPEPTKQTLRRTTEAPVSTTETRSAKIELKPIIHKKKIEIHKELPMNTSAPHKTQFKQDFKEIEIIKEMPLKPNSFKRVPQRKPQKNLEALELYKDEKLAEEVNKLGAVEVFKENLDLTKGPRHGGNYRSAFDMHAPTLEANIRPSKDAETSQSKTEKLVDITEVLPARRINERDFRERSRNRERSAKLELREPKVSSMHGGNLKSQQDLEKRRGTSKNAKLVEFREEHEDDDSEEDTQGYRSYDASKANSRPLHGGNYRSAKLIEDHNKDDSDSIKIKASANDHRSKSAVLLSSFAQAVPHLTTTPAYIRDPSKRMYYYVDTKR